MLEIYFLKRDNFPNKSMEEIIMNSLTDRTVPEYSSMAFYGHRAQQSAVFLQSQKSLQLYSRYIPKKNASLTNPSN